MTTGPSTHSGVGRNRMIAACDADPVPGKIIEVLLTFNRTSGTGFYASADAADLAACSIFAQ